MNKKILLAFAAGVILASGVTYVMVNRKAPATAAAPQTTAQSTPPASNPSEPKAVETTPAPAPVPEQHAVQRRSKPSPIGQPQHPKATEAAATVPSELKQPPAQQEQPKQTEQQPVQPVTPPVQAATTPDPVTPPPVLKSEPPPPPPPNRVTIAQGTLLSVRLGETLSSERNMAGDTFFATLDQPLVVDGFVIAERGARAEGKVVDVDKAGRVKGLAHLSIELTRLHTSDGQIVSIRTTPFSKEGPSSKKEDAAKVGVGAALGAAIGAIAGGGKGAGIGAGVGGAAGAGDVMMTRGKAAELPVETRLSLRIESPVTITEKLKN